MSLIRRKTRLNTLQNQIQILNTNNYSQESTPTSPPKPKSKYPYKEVNVLLFCWEEDDLGCWREIATLKELFEYNYNFNVEWHRVPSTSQHVFVEDTLKNYKKRYASPDSLLIFYYGGHAAYDYEFFLAAGGTEATLNWNKIYSLLQSLPSDVLILLDCCDASAALTAAQRTSPSHKIEIIAACNFPGLADGVGETSLTWFFTRELYLRSHSKEVFSAASLYRGAVEQIIDKNWRIQFQHENDGIPIPNPVHFIMGEWIGGSILLKAAGHPVSSGAGLAPRQLGYKAWKTPQTLGQNPDNFPVYDWGWLYPWPITPQLVGPHMSGPPLKQCGMILPSQKMQQYRPRRFWRF